MKNPQRTVVSFCVGLLAAIAFLLLSGCAPKPVSIPVPAACVKVSDIPPDPERVASKLTGDARQDVALLAVAVLDMRDYAGKLRALLRGCE